MAKHPRNRKFNLRMVRINANSAIGALASFDVVANIITGSPAGKLRVKSFDCAYAIVDKTDADEGQTIGLAHSDYSAAEIEECLEASTAIDAGDKVAQERANRLVREIGVFSRGDTGGKLNEGKPIKTKLNWLLTAGDSIQLWIRNSSGTVYTTGALIAIVGKFWVQDSA